MVILEGQAGDTNTVTNEEPEKVEPKSQNLLSLESILYKTSLINVSVPYLISPD